jgi:uncharacterized alpha-E superfamily protein
MLSRIAESLFWTGRYLERAEDTARLLDVQINQLLEGANIAEATVANSLLSVMGVPLTVGENPTLREVTAALSVSRAEPSSIYSSLRGARENARGIRESISTELWECLNATLVALDARGEPTTDMGPHEFFRYARLVRERVAIAGGIADATMSRDDGWQFMLLGRNLERADMTARLLAAQLNDAGREPDWSTTLRACSAYEAYLRTYRGVIVAANAVEFLTLDRFFPRSIYFALATAEECLGILDQQQSRTGGGEAAKRIMGRARTRLEYETVTEIIQHLPDHLGAIQAACSEASAAIATTYFQREATLAWRSDDSSSQASGEW